MNKRMLILLSISACCRNVWSEPVPEVHSIVSDFPLADQFVGCHPQLALLQAYDDIPFPQVSEPVARRALMSRMVTPVIFPVNLNIFSPNRYAIYSMACPDGSPGLCHYLSVMPTMGFPQHRVYGPLDLAACPHRPAAAPGP